MMDQPVGLMFREKMAGDFALGETDPIRGQSKGQATGSKLAMYATVQISDLHRFIADSTHTGSITGHIDFPPFGIKLPAKTGVFNLFSPTENPKLKLMIYELGFEHQGQDYYLAGQKEVRDDPGIDLWKDTTTLLTRLHRGSDKAGPVIGAGILTLDIIELKNLLATTQVLNAPSATAQAKAIAEFGRFFLGELWETYFHKGSS